MVYSNNVYFNTDSAFPPPISHLAKNYVTIKGVILSYDLTNDIPSGKIGTSTKLR